METIQNLISPLKYAKIRIDLTKDFPVTIYGDSFHGRKNRKLLLRDMISSEDLPNFIAQLDDVFKSPENILHAHARISTGGDAAGWNWFLIRCERAKETFGKVYLDGILLDVTTYTDTINDDPALLEFRRKEDEKMSRAINRKLLLTDVLDPKYLEQIQQPFIDRGLFSAIYDDEDKIICAPITPDKAKNFVHVEKSEIRISRIVAAHWTIAAPTQELLDECKHLHLILLQAISQIANSFALLYNETYNSDRANKLLSEHIEQQILVNNVYNLILERKGSAEALAAVFKLVGEYMSMRRICVYEDAPDEKSVKLIYEWKSPKSPDSAKPDYAYSEIAKIQERLEYTDMYLPPSGENPSGVFMPDNCTVANLIGDGVRFGIITFAPLVLGRVPTAPESKILRSVSQITAALLMQKKADEKIKESDEKLKHLAFNDPILHIPNRAMLDKELETELQSGGTGAAATVKITNLHTFNELFGHEYTDSMLRDVAKHIADLPVQSLTVYRFSGTALMFLWRGADEVAAKELVENLINRFKKPWKQADGEHYLDAGIGVTIYPNGQSGQCLNSIGAGIRPMPDSAYIDIEQRQNCADAIYRAAALALYKATEYGTNSYAFYTDEFKAEADINYEHARNLRNAIINNMRDFTIKYQPITPVDPAEEAPFVCYEALISREDLPTEKLIQLAENMGLDIEIDKWVMRNACIFCKQMQETRPDFAVSVNVTPRVLRSGSVIGMVRDALEQSGLGAGSLLLEIPERVFADNLTGILPILKKLRDSGTKLIIDSFGSDFGGLRLLRHSYVDMVKIDFSLFTNVFSEFDEIWVNAVSKLATSLEHGICVKRIENPEQLNNAKKYGVKYAQGNLFAAPSATINNE